MSKPGNHPAAQSNDCACALIVDQGRIFLGLRAAHNDTYPNVWDVFGGHCEDDETVEEALIRELHEELDILPTTVEFLATFSEPNPHVNGACRYHFFKITAWSGSGPLNCGDEHITIRWHTLDEALALDLAAEDLKTLFRSCC